MDAARSVSGVNDFVIRFANVNGTGSASANGMIAKAIFRMGVPIGPKNMFPSNIQGLPTWFEIRVSESSFTGRRGSTDLMVAMNRATLSRDQQAVAQGGFVLYDSTKEITNQEKDERLHYLPMPITAMARSKVANPRQRALVQNMLYVGAVSALIGIEKDVIVQLIEELFIKKPKLVPINVEMMHEGHRYARDTFSTPLPFRVERRQLTDNKILLDGNNAIALGCVFAGATVVGWYPITPSTSVIESFQRFCRAYRTTENGEKNFAIVQGEDEIAACGIVMGAAWNGARAFTATSGPGISLMNELIGYAYYAELPLVLFNIQRNGPSTGMPTRNQQADILLCAHASHGDTRHLLLFPSNPSECFEMAVQAFDYAEGFQTPVIVLSDLEIGMNEYVSDQLEWDDRYRWQRGKVLDHGQLSTREKPFYRYQDVDGDGVCFRTYPGEHPKGAYFTRGSGHDQFGRYTEDGKAYQQNLDRIQKKVDVAADALPAPVVSQAADRRSDAAIVFYGSTTEVVDEALDLAQAFDRLDKVRIRAFPFSQAVIDLLTCYKQLMVVEQNQGGQLCALLSATGRFRPQQLAAICLYDGLPIEASVLATRIRDTVSLSS